MVKSHCTGPTCSIGIIAIYRYRFVIDMGDFGDIGICLNILLADTDISVSVSLSVYRYWSNSSLVKVKNLTQGISMILGIRRLEARLIIMRK